VGAGSIAAMDLRRTEVGDGLPASWRGLELRTWGWAGDVKFLRVLGSWGSSEFPIHPQLHGGGGGTFGPQILWV
jgi:hypothetical protein